MAERKPAVYLTRPIPEPLRSQLAAECEVRTWDRAEAAPRQAVLAAVAEVEGLLTTYGIEPVDAELLAAAPRLRVVANNGFGYNNIDVAAATARGVLVGNTPGVTGEPLADLAFGLMLACARRIPEMHELVRGGGWRHPWALMEGVGVDVYGATLGIVGLGASGQGLARRARGFEMRVLYTSRSRRPELEGPLGLEWVELPMLLERADFVSLHLPLSEASRGLLGPAELRRMKPTAYLINVARGPIVQKEALLQALREGWIAGAGLDVFDVEPIPPDDPMLQAPNVILTPHRGAATLTCRLRQTGLAVANLLAGVRGEPLPACVNPEARGKGQ